MLPNISWRTIYAKLGSAYVFITAIVSYYWMRKMKHSCLFTLALRDLFYYCWTSNIAMNLLTQYLDCIKFHLLARLTVYSSNIRLNVVKINHNISAHILHCITISAYFQNINVKNKTKYVRRCTQRSLRKKRGIAI